MAVLRIEDNWFQGHVSLQREGEAVAPWRIPYDKIMLHPDERFLEMASRSAGVRLRIRTDADTLTLHVRPVADRYLLDLVCDNEIVSTQPVGPKITRVVFANVPTGRTIEIWLSQGSQIWLDGLEVPDGATVQPVADDRPRWITYGSSITNCRTANSAARIWPGVAARMRDLHHTCLGYAGQCHLDGMVARMIRDLPADLITLKVGINMHDGTVSQRTFRPMLLSFVETVRDTHADTPIVLISPIISPDRETTPGAQGYTLEMMREHVADCADRLRQAGDTNVSYVDGLSLFGADLVDDYLPDLLHPNGDGYEILGQNFATQILDPMGIGTK